MKITVAASADFENIPLLLKEVKAFLDTIDNGGDKDVRFFYSKKHTRLGNQIRAITAPVRNWFRYPMMCTGAPALRKKLVETADHILIFWDGKSTGTQKLIDMAEKEGKNFRLVMY